MTPQATGFPPALARELAAYIQAEVRRQVQAARVDDDPDPWVPHTKWPCASRRAACSLARSGALEGVRHVGRGRGALYLVRRSVLDAWVEKEHAGSGEALPEEDAFEREMAKRRLVAGGARHEPSVRRAKPKAP